MKPSLLLSIFVFAGLARAGEADAMAPLFEQYHQLQSALAGDDFQSAKKAAGSLLATLGKVGGAKLADAVTRAWTDQRPKLQKAAGAAQTASNMEDMRAHFEEVSTCMISLAEAARPEGFSRYRCPMAFDNKGADWLQKGETTSNPYFGSAMLRCGYQVREESSEN